MTTRTPSYTFTRPADTTQYTSGDIVANSTTAASITPLSWSIEGMQGASGIIRGVRVYKSNKTVTAGSFRVHLFTADPGVPTNGDNGAFGIADASNFLDTVAVDLSSSSMAGGTTGAKKRSAAVAIPFTFPTTAMKLYGLIDVQGTYTPTSAETFTITLELESST